MRQRRQYPKRKRFDAGPVGVRLRKIRGHFGYRQYEMADHLGTCFAQCTSGDPDRGNPGNLEGNWRDSPARCCGGFHLYHLRSGWTFLEIHGSTHPNLPMDLPSTRCIQEYRRGRNHHFVDLAVYIECICGVIEESI